MIAQQPRTPLAIGTKVTWREAGVTRSGVVLADRDGIVDVRPSSGIGRLPSLITSVLRTAIVVVHA